MTKKEEASKSSVAFLLFTVFAIMALLVYISIQEDQILAGVILSVIAMVIFAFTVNYLAVEPPKPIEYSENSFRFEPRLKNHKKVPITTYTRWPKTENDKAITTRAHSEMQSRLAQEFAGRTDPPGYQEVEVIIGRAVREVVDFVAIKRKGKIETKVLDIDNSSSNDWDVNLGDRMD